jgi:hypothetical protein
MPNLFQSHNLRCVDGMLRSFEIVPFPNGELPTMPPVSLHSPFMISNLTH